MSAASGVGQPYQFEVVRGIPLVTFDESLAQAPFATVERAGTDLVERMREIGPRHLFVDLTALSYMGSAQVALIVRIWKVVKDAGGKTVVAASAGAVREVIALARLDQHWTMVGSEEEGLRVLGVRRDDGEAAPQNLAPSVGDDSQPLPVILAVVGAAVAVLGAALTASPSSPVAPPIALGITGAAAVLGVVAGAILVLGPRTARRVAGGVSLLVCVVSLVVALALQPTGDATDEPVVPASTE